MAWEDDMVETLRVLTNDMDEASPTQDDDKLVRVLLVAARQVLQELDFSQNFTADLQGQTIAPDPTATATKDDSFVNLVSLKAAAIIDRGSAMAAANRAISVRDGTSAIDLRSVFAAKLALLKQGWEAVYQDAKLEYLSGLAGVAGAAVLTPFRTYMSELGGRGIQVVSNSYPD